ncbi:uncharacterized protein [Lolium perenne]|uniref:uncharacterized protein n=1 Tax=Lolium perenne TaxID=4522 RepID=UPI0021F550C2|nr:uncharacterized protein LOC127334648 [Lolium perenne]
MPPRRGGRVGGRGHRRDDDLPPPPPNLAEVMVNQTRLLEEMIRSNAAHRAPQDQEISLMDFQKCDPPNFTSASEPLVADDWLRDMEFKFQHMRIPNGSKVLFATYQFRGPALAWWQSQLAMQPAGQEMSWADFCTLFRCAYVPESTIGLMKQKFRALKQERRSVDEYLGEFEHLSRYAPRDVEDEKEKIQAFLNGLCEDLHEKLVTHDFPDFRTLVDKARLAKRASISSEIARKRKREAFQASKAGSSSSRQDKPVPISSGGKMFHNQQPYTHPRHQQQQLQQHNQRQGGGQFKDNKNKNVECWNCHERGHFSTSCTKPKKAGEHLGPHKAPPRGSTSGARPAAKVNARRARINHIEVAAAEESPEVILGDEEGVNCEDGNSKYQQGDKGKQPLGCINFIILNMSSLV